MAPSTSTGQLAATARAHRPQADVVAIERDVDRSDRHGALDALDLGAERLGHPHAAALEADENDALQTAVALDDLVGDAGERPANVVGAEHLLGGSGPRGLAALRRSHRSFRPGLTGPASRSDVRVHEQAGRDLSPLA